jgi:hypothetical protein
VFIGRAGAAYREHHWGTGRVPRQRPAKKAVGYAMSAQLARPLGRVVMVVHVLRCTCIKKRARWVEGLQQTRVCCCVSSDLVSDETEPHVLLLGARAVTHRIVRDNHVQTQRALYIATALTFVDLVDRLKAGAHGRCCVQLVLVGPHWVDAVGINVAEPIGAHAHIRGYLCRFLLRQ